MNLITETADLEVCNMETRIIIALLIILCVVPPLVYDDWLIDLLITFIIVVDGTELLSLKEQDTEWPPEVKTLAIMAVFVLVLSDERLHAVLLGTSALVSLSMSVLIDRFHAKDGFLCIVYVTFFLVVARCFLHIYGTNRMYVWFIITTTYACDIAAYLYGRFLGEHRLNVRISLKKTWEGSIDGWFLGVLLSLVFAWFMIDTMTPLQMMITSTTLMVTGQINDLAFNAIKRNFGIRDLSDLLPGHGDVLDRMDSLVFNFIRFDLMLVVLML